MTPTKNVAIEPQLFDRIAEEAAAEGKTADDLANDAARRYMSRRWLDRTKREAQSRRGNMTDAEVEAVVEKAVQDSRAEQRPR
jgi:hypothetical protein